MTTKKRSAITRALQLTFPIPVVRCRAGTAEVRAPRKNARPPSSQLPTNSPGADPDQDRGNGEKAHRGPEPFSHLRLVNRKSSDRASPVKPANVSARSAFTSRYRPSAGSHGWGRRRCKRGSASESARCSRRRSCPRSRGARRSSRERSGEPFHTFSSCLLSLMGLAVDKRREERHQEKREGEEAAARPRRTLLVDAMGQLRSFSLNWGQRQKSQPLTSSCVERR